MYVLFSERKAHSYEKCLNLSEGKALFSEMYVLFSEKKAHSSEKCLNLSERKTIFSEKILNFSQFFNILPTQISASMFSHLSSY